jgi:hypothetical protein
MGFLDKLTGTKRPKEGTAVKSAAEIRAALLALNRDTAPWQVRAAEPAEECDLVVEWKIIDKAWHGIFGKAKLQSVFIILLKFDSATNEVRALDKEWLVAWNAGMPILSAQTGGFRGQMNETTYNIGWGFTETSPMGEVIKYRFSTGEMKKPLKEAVTAAGWTYKAIVFGKL